MILTINFPGKSDVISSHLSSRPHKQPRSNLANMTDEKSKNEYPTSVKQIGRWHDVPNGNGVIIVGPKTKKI